MRPNLGWQMFVIRSLSVMAVLAWATATTWGQATSNPNPNRPEPLPTNPSQTPDRNVTTGQQPGAVGSNVANPEEATGTGPVFGAHFEHGMRGAQQELKIKSIDQNSPASQA